MRTSRALILGLSSAVVLLWECSPEGPVAGGTIETTNGVTASVRYPNGEPAAQAIVRLRETDFLADTVYARAKQQVSTVDILTDDSGSFAIESIDAGEYLIEVVDANNNGCVMTLLAGMDTLADFGVQILEPMGRISGSVLAPSQGFVRVRGLERCATAGATGEFSLSVPTGYTYEVNAVTKDTTLDTMLVQPVLSSQSPALIFDFNSYTADSIGVRAFLDSMGMVAVPVESVTVADAATGRLRELTLAHRNVATVHPSISSLRSVWTLDLGSNPITDLPSTLSGMVSLRNLVLDSTDLPRLPDVVTDCRMLRLLDISSTGIRDLPPTTANLSNLDVLSMNDDSLVSVPPVVFSLTTLTTLGLSDNDLTSIPSAMGELPNLVTLGLDRNRVDSLPGEITTLAHLRILFAYSNNLTGLPDSIGRLTALEVLDIQSNGITALPESIGSCASLRLLHLWGNQLTGLPATIVNIQPVDGLYLGSNRLCSLAPSIAAWADTYAEATWLNDQICP